MPLQKLTMSSDYSHRPIDSLPQKTNPNPPRAILVSSTRSTGKSVPQLSNNIFLVPKFSPGTPHIRKPIGNGTQSQLESYGNFDTEIKPLVKTRKFAEFSVGEEVAMGRATSLSQSHHPNLKSTSTRDNPLDFFRPINPILSSVSQPTIQIPEDHCMSSNLHHPATLSKSESLSTSLQLAENLDPNASARNWPHALLTTCVVGVAAIAVVAGYACSTAVRGAMNLGQFICSNRESIQQTCITCTQAVQSTYNAAKRRMVSVRRLPVGVSRRYALSPISQGRSRQRRFPWHYRIPEQLTQSSSLIASTLLPEGMQGVECNTLSNISPIPASSNAVASDAPILPSTFDGSASYLHRVNGAFLHKPSPSPSKLVSSPNELLSSLDAPQAGANSHGHQSRLTPTESSDIKRGNLPHTTFYQSPRTGLPVNRTKKFIKDEPMDFPLGDSTLNASSIFEPFEIPTQKGQDAKGSKTGPLIRDGSSSPQGLTSPLIASKIPGRRKPPRAKGRKKKAAKLRQEKKAAEAAEATERARVAAEETTRKEKEEEEGRLKRGCRRVPKGEMIQPLDAKWELSVNNAMATLSMQEVLATTSNGSKLTRRDLGTLKVVKGRDPPRGWLNDEIILACLQQVVDYGLQASNHKVGETPQYHAFSTFFYTNLREKGVQSVGRWANKAKIGKESLLKVERLFIPVHSGAHWSLLVVSPIARTIEYFDSLGGPARPYIFNTKAWLRAELGKLYKEDEWTVPTGSFGAGPQQSNSSDCGVFTCTNARMMVLGVDPMAYAGSDMEIQRTRMVAELLNGGLNGDFEPRVVF